MGIVPHRSVCAASVSVDAGRRGEEVADIYLNMQEDTQFSGGYSEARASLVS